MTNRKTGNQKRKYSFNRYEDIDKCIWKVFDNFGHDEKIENLVYWTRKLKKERAAFRKKAVKYDELQSILEEYNVTPQNIREVLLTGQMFKNQPTLEECIKEWEEKNAQIKMNHKHLLTIYIPHKDIDKYIIVINFWKTSKQYDTHIYDTEEKNVYPADISFELHDLIHKTVKALEVEND